MTKLKNLFGLGLLTLAFTLTSCNQDEIDGLNREIDANEAQIASLQGQLDTANSQIANYQSIIQDLHATNGALEISLSEAEALASELGAELSAANANIESLNAQLDELNAVLAETQAELEATVAAAAAQAEADGIEINRLMNELDEARAQSEVDAARIAELEAQLAAADSSTRELIQNIREKFLFLYAPSVDTDGDGFSNLLSSDGSTLYGDLNDEDLTDAQLLDSFAGFAAKMGS